MKTLNCSEIYYASTEKAMTNGSPGFGVRSFTRDLGAEIADRIAAEIATGYSVDYDRQLSLEDLEQDPAILYKYTPEYSLRKLEIPNGKTFYVAMRTIYLAVDYGFFGDRNGAMRVGSNYFSHLFVFDENPGDACFAAIEREQLWRPANYSADPTNAELRSLLTGEPIAIQPSTLAIEQLSLDLLSRTKGMDQLTVALLQARDNQLSGKDAMLGKVIVEQHESLTPPMIIALGALPREITDNMWFATNYDKGYSVPDDLSMVFVNENNKLELFRDNHVSIDLINGTSCNIDATNPVYSRIATLIREGDTATLKIVLKWYLGLDNKDKSDLEFAYDILLATDTPNPLNPDLVDVEFIRKACALRLPNDKRSILFSKINDLINSTITESNSGARIMHALGLAVALDEATAGGLRISENAAAKLRRIIWEKGTDGYLGRLVNASNVKLICKISTPEEIGSSDRFYSALMQSDDQTVWATVINHYYRGVLSADMDTILSAILNSRLSNEDKNSLVGHLFPIDSKATFLSDMVSWYKMNPQALVVINEPIDLICRRSREECFSRLVDASTPRNIAALIGPKVIDYFEPRLRENPNNAMEEIALMIKRMSPEVFEQLDAMNLFELYLEESYRMPSEKAVRVIDNIRRFGVRIPDALLDRLNALQCVLTAKVPAAVNLEIMLLATKTNGLSADYFHRLAMLWMSGNSLPSPSELKQFVKTVHLTDPALIGALIDAVWQSESRMVAPRRKEYVEGIVDNAKWSSEQKKNYIASCRDAELAAVIRKADSLIGKIFRKLF